MSVRRSGFAFSGRPKLGVGIAIVCTCAGCSCLSGNVSDALVPTIKSNVAVTSRPRARIIYYGTPGPVVDVGTPDETLVQSAAVDPELLKKAEPPSCEIEGATKPPAGAGLPGANADPNLLRIARLQLVSECYKDAERAVRRRLERLQRLSFKNASVDSELLKKAEPASCEIEGATKPPPGAGLPGANADPNLLEIARLQLASECHKAAERAVRRRLERLQRSYVHSQRS